PSLPRNGRPTEMPGGMMKNATTIASAGEISASPAARPRRNAADARAAATSTALVLLEDYALVAFDDVGEVIGQRERPAVFREVRRRDVGEELAPGRGRELRLHVLRVDPRVPVELLDDAVGLHLRAFREVDELLGKRRIGRLRRDNVVHRLPRQTGLRQRELDLRAHLAVSLP